MINEHHRPRVYRNSRRGLLRSAICAGFGGLLASYSRSLALNPVAKQGRFKRCVVLWMSGGPSQQDTFDPKPTSDRKSIRTSVSGLEFAETLPELAKRASELCVVRSVGSREGEHERATELMHTGFSPVPAFPRPALASIFTNERHANDDARLHGPIPSYVTLGDASFGPAFLGESSAPFVVGDLASAKKQIDQIASNRTALDLLKQMNDGFQPSGVSREISKRAAAVSSIRGLVDTEFSKTLDPSSASASDQERYGKHEFGQRVLAAKRLLEIGVPFIEVQMSGWDTHIDNDRRTNSLCEALEQPWVALMDDLQRSALWDDTLLVWMGEFGRTPQLNGRGGRDHFPETIPVVLGGGDLGGRVIGHTNQDGTRRQGDVHSVGDLMATLLTLLGVDVAQEFTTEFGSPTTVTDDGSAIPSIVS